MWVTSTRWFLLCIYGLLVVILAISCDNCTLAMDDVFGK